MFAIIWPEKRHVSDAQITTWYEDAVANGEIEQQDIDAHDQYVGVEKQARLLHHIGHITLQRRPASA